MRGPARLSRQGSAAARQSTGVAKAVDQAAWTGGQPLDGTARAFLEPRFGHDFGQVRIHAGAEADELARSLQASACTVGQDIFFGDGAYQPDTLAGMSLLAHEVTHTVQQRDVDARNLPGNLAVTERRAAVEREARAAGTSVLAGQRAQVGARSEAVVAREDQDPLLSNVSDILGLPGAMTGLGLFGGLDPISQALGVAGNLQKAAGASDMTGVVGGISGAIGSQLGLVGSLGADTLGSGTLDVLGGLGSGFNALQSATDMYSDLSKGDFFKAIAGDATKALGGGLSSAASFGGFSLLGEGGLAGALGAVSEGGLGVLGTVGGIEGSALTMSAGSALAGEGLSGLAALGPVGAVIGAFGGGVAAGIGLDQLSDKIGDAITGNAQADHSISGGLASVMTSVDQAGTGLLRSIGVLDESKPEYTQTLGWQLAQATDSAGEWLGSLF